MIGLGSKYELSANEGEEWLGVDLQELLEDFVSDEQIEIMSRVVCREGRLNENLPVAEIDGVPISLGVGFESQKNDYEEPKIHRVGSKIFLNFKKPGTDN
jgi:hypothetical protein